MQMAMLNSFTLMVSTQKRLSTSSFLAKEVATSIGSLYTEKMCWLMACFEVGMPATICRVSAWP